MMHDGTMGFGWFWMVVWATIVVVPVWRICEKAGYSGALGLLVLIPLVNIGLLYFPGFAKWPVTEDRTEGAGR